jgi:hypothetical protein
MGSMRFQPYNDDPHLAEQVHCRWCVNPDGVEHRQQRSQYLLCIRVRSPWLLGLSQHLGLNEIVEPLAQFIGGQVRQVCRNLREAAPTIQER